MISTSNGAEKRLRMAPRIDTSNGSQYYFTNPQKRNGGPTTPSPAERGRRRSSNSGGSAWDSGLSSSSSFSSLQSPSTPVHEERPTAGLYMNESINPDISLAPQLMSSFDLGASSPLMQHNHFGEPFSQSFAKELSNQRDYGTYSLPSFDGLNSQNFSDSAATQEPSFGFNPSTYFHVDGHLPSYSGFSSPLDHAFGTNTTSEEPAATILPSQTRIYSPAPAPETPHRHADNVALDYNFYSSYSLHSSPEHANILMGRDSSPFDVSSISDDENSPYPQKQFRSSTSQSSATSSILSHRVSSSTDRVNKVSKRSRKQKSVFCEPVVSSEDTKPFACKLGANCCKSTGKPRRFARLEHLKRHELTHTNEKPYICSMPACSRAFSRSDNLKQHEITHTKEGGRNVFSEEMVKKKNMREEEARRNKLRRKGVV